MLDRKYGKGIKFCAPTNKMNEMIDRSLIRITEMSSFFDKTGFGD